jgi:20S proteasome alpha/beta subunit
VSHVLHGADEGCHYAVPRTEVRTVCAKGKPMTLIVGIKCKDGIVMGADSAQTMHGYIHQSTKKLATIGKDLIIGSSGAGSIAHQLRWALDAASTSGFIVTKDLHSAANSLKQSMLAVVQQNYQDCASLRQVSSNPPADPHSESLVALPVANQVRLLHFNHACSLIEITDDVCFGSIGSGTFAANPFLLLIKRTWWADNQPSVADGIIATVWALDHAIQTSSGGVAEPKQLITLTKDNRQWKAQEFSSDELVEHHEIIERLEARLGETLREELDRCGQVALPRLPLQMCGEGIDN